MIFFHSNVRRQKHENLNNNNNNNNAVISGYQAEAEYLRCDGSSIIYEIILRSKIN